MSASVKYLSEWRYINFKFQISVQLKPSPKKRTHDVVVHFAPFLVNQSKPILVGLLAKASTTSSSQKDSAVDSGSAPVPEVCSSSTRFPKAFIICAGE